MAHPSKRAVLWPVVWVLIVLGGVAGVLVTNADAREHVSDSAKMVLAVVATPFVFETTCAVFFILALMMYNRWRLHKEGDGWVYILDHQSDDATLPKALTERLHNIIVSSKPEILDEHEARNSVVEGFLELGMGAQALAEFEAMRSWPDDARNAQLRIRVLAANADTDAAQTLLRLSIQRFASAKKEFVLVALENARWTVLHLQNPELAQQWIQEARLIDPTAGSALPEHDPLRSVLKA